MTQATKASHQIQAEGVVRRVTFPFPAIIGYTDAKRALLMLAVDRELRGLLVSSRRDSDTSTVARSFAALISDVDSNPKGSISGDSPDSIVAPDIVELPISISDDGLLGSLDLERTIASGKPHFSKGILAKSNGRILYVNDINLLEADACGHLADALDRRRICIEREGVSALHEADFTLIGTFNPDEGEPAALLRDRIGLIVDLEAKTGDDQSVEIIERALGFDDDPAQLATDFASETSLVRKEIESGRARLPVVKITTDQIWQLSEVAVRLGIEGNRCDVFALKAARASAALAGRDCVTEEDLITAVQLVLMPRATSAPEARPAMEESPNASHHRSDKQDSQSNDDNGNDYASGPIDDLILEALDARLSDDLLFSKERAPRASRSGKRLKGSKSIWGRYVRSQIRRVSSSRVAIDATLRAAAPYQRARLRKLNNLIETNPETRQGATTRSRSRVRIDPCDLRYKEFKHRSGILFIFAVDASGSMALNRIAQAKGAVTRLLQQAYLHRDQVALVSFQRNAAEVLLTPTRSIELAKRLTDAIPAGGGTPLAAGVAKSIEVARSAKLRGMPQSMIVLFTDGRANVLFSNRTGSDAPTIADELRQLGMILHEEEIKTVLVDTKPKHLGGGECKAIAELLGARYLSLLRSDPKTIYDAITSAAERDWDA